MSFTQDTDTAKIEEALNSKFNIEQLDNLFSHHPYLLLIQKDDWKEYALIIQDLYEILEDESARMPFEIFKTYLIKFYSAKKIQNIEAKTHQFFLMTIGELKVFKDSHDALGQRYIETTRAGKQLIQWLKGILNQKIKYSGTGAETLLGSLNDILVARKQLTLEEALEHHQEKIKKYQEDIKRIKSQGVAFAELLPIPHSNEALFNQAEESGNQILAAVEDVKIAIEKERQDLSKSYFEGKRSAGKNLNAVTEFYEGLYKSPEYISYEQAKNLLSFLNNYGNRFRIKIIDRILNEIRNKKLISDSDIKKSNLKNFGHQFYNADLNIQEKIKSQIKILQQQVAYSMSTDVLGLQGTLKELLGLAVKHSDQMLSFFTAQTMEIKINSDFEVGGLQVFNFAIPPELEVEKIQSHLINESEEKELILALLQAEEITLQQVIEKFYLEYANNPHVTLELYPFSFGLAEYYVLSHLPIFIPEFEIRESGHFDLNLQTKYSDIVLMDIPNLKYTKVADYGN